eukprot:Hpha_TRINITY_DN12917_c0_g1::TRINITY_DN12917_c0_g1_i2::g.164513::m.164513
MRALWLCSLVSVACSGSASASAARGADREVGEWLKGTVWNWNSWRHVTLASDGGFEAPTSDCEAGRCSWKVAGGKLIILWGDAGRHTMALPTVPIQRGFTINGKREANGEACKATFVSKESEHAAIEDPEGDNFYAELGLEKGVESTASEIKSAYRKLSRKLHPDLNPSEDAKLRYERVQEAYSILSDRKKKKIYDIMGKDGLKQLQDADRGGGQSHHPFASFFGGGGQAGPDRGEDMHFEIRVTLDDVYNGAEHVVPIQKQKLKSWDVVRKCMKCKAQPPKMQRVNMMGMIMQQQVPPDCTRQCSSRSGSVRKHHDLEVTVEAGTPEGHEIVYEMEADEYADRIPGDVKFSVSTAPHSRFVRDDDNLEMRVRISLLESLIGFEKTYAHMDGHEFTISRDMPTPHDFVMTVPGEGMPKHHVPSEKGDLMVHFEVVFPKKVSQEQAAVFKDLLGT